MKSSPELPSEENKNSPLDTQSERKREIKISAKGERKKRYDGRGRRNNDDEIDLILDTYLLYNILPVDVTERMRREYRKHPRLELRRMYLEKAGHFKKGRNGNKGNTDTGANGASVLPFRRKRA